MNTSRTFAKLAAALVATSLGLIACSDGPTTTTHGRQTSASVVLSVSSRSAAIGSRVAVAVTLDAAPGSAGGIQGTLRYDAARLRYIGQSTEGAAITIVNVQGAELGELRFTSFHPLGVSGRVASLVFEAAGANYADGLRYEHQVASTAGAGLRRLAVVVRNGVSEDRSLVVASDARHLSLADWRARVTTGGRAGPIALRPGEYRLNLAYGDVDFDGSVGLFDYLSVANAAVGNDEIIIGTDGPAVDVDLVIAGNVFPSNGSGACGTETDGRRVLDLFDYLAIANEAVGVNEGCVGDVIPGRTALPSTTQTLGPATTPGLLVGANDTLRLTNDRVWILDGTLTVDSLGVLEIAAGTRIEGLTGSTQTTAIFVKRNGRIYSNGTQNQPVVMTCTGTTLFKGCWGGVFIAGKGTVNLGDGTLGLSPDGCNQRRGEGNAPLYGGCDPNDNSGVVRYTIIEYGGRVVTQDSELNGLTLGAVGRGTTIEFIQIHAGTDDGIEFFGGEVNVRNLVLTGNDDDQFDLSFGYTGEAQFVVAQSDAGNAAGDSKGIEADGNEPAPGQILAVRTAPKLYNFTLIGTLNQNIAANVGAIHLRRANGLTLANSLVAGYARGLDIDDALTCDPWGTGAVKILNTTFIDIPDLGNNDGSDPACVAGGSTTEGEEAFINAEATNRVATGIGSILRDANNTFLPDWRMLLVGGAPAEAGTAAPPAGSTFIVSTTYRGAVAPMSSAGDIPWYAGWTRPFQGATTP